MPGTQRLRQPAKSKPSYDPQQTWPPPMEGSSRVMLATARPSCSVLAKRSTGKCVSNMTCLVLSKGVEPELDQSVNQSKSKGQMLRLLGLASIHKSILYPKMCHMLPR